VIAMTNLPKFRNPEINFCYTDKPSTALAEPKSVRQLGP
jgi:hypothetical protein